MCMLSFFPAGIQPIAEQLMNGARTNDDGHGYAIVVPNGEHPFMIVRHSLDNELVIEKFVSDREKYPEGPALFHSRWGTSGEYGKFNCHPFTVNNDARTVVAHNGILPSKMQPNSKDRRCDTRMAADDIFGTEYGHLSLKTSRLKLGLDIGKGNKLVILTIDPEFKENAYIINEDSGQWTDDGIWYSNSDYKGWSRTFTSGSWSNGRWNGWGWGDEYDSDDWEYAEGVYTFGGKTTDSRTLTADEQSQVEGTAEYDYSVDCPACKTKGSVNPIHEYCEACGTCMDCFETLPNCICYWSPSAGGWTKDDDGDDDSKDENGNIIDIQTRIANAIALPAASDDSEPRI